MLFRSDGGLSASLADFARLGQLYVQEGSWNGRQVLPSSWVAACRTGDREAFAPLYADRFSALPESAYSRQWWVFDTTRGRHAALGIFGQMILIDPMSEIVAVKLSSWPQPLDDTMRLTTLRAIDAMVAALT